MHAFYLDPARWQPPFILEGRELRHIVKSLRLKTGEHILLLDGQGRSGEFTIHSLGENKIHLELIKTSLHPHPPGRCFLAAAYTKAARRGFLMEKATELEAGGIWFWQAERSQGGIPTEAGTRWREQLIAGAKQSLNPWLPELKTIPGGAAALSAEAAAFSQRFILWEEAGSRDVLPFADLALREDSIFVMGPEGGLSHKEVDLLRGAGFTPVSLGGRVLRWETAAVLCLGLAWWGRNAHHAAREAS